MDARRAVLPLVVEFDPPPEKLPSTLPEHTDDPARVAAESDRCVVLSSGMTDRACKAWGLDTFRRVPELYLHAGELDVYNV